MLLYFRYKLPFKPPTHHSTSPHTIEIPGEGDPLTKGVLAELLRFTWNNAWNDGVEEAIKNAGSGGAETDHL